MTTVPAHVCPTCDSTRIERIPRRRLSDRIAGIFGRRLYRCRECGTRFYDRPALRKAS